MTAYFKLYFYLTIKYYKPVKSTSRPYYKKILRKLCWWSRLREKKGPERYFTRQPGM